LKAEPEEPEPRPGSPGLAALASARSDWVERGRAEGLRRWLGRELDPDGVPRRLPVAEWSRCLAELAVARRRRVAGWPEFFDARVEGLFRQTLRFSRPDGTPVFGPAGRDAAAGSLFRSWAEELPDPGLSTVVDWWFPSGERRHAPPPLPAHSCPDRPLAMLRANWQARGDLMAIDHRDGGLACGFELRGQGRSWLGPWWGSTLEGDPDGRARPSLWASNSSADLLEWTFRVGSVRVVRAALLLRGRKLALLADQVEGGGPSPGMRIGLAEEITAEALPGSRALGLVTARGRTAAQVLPLGLPGNPYPTDRGSFVPAGPALELRQARDGRRAWLPLLVSWEPARHRKGVRWKPLTVSERSKVTPPDVASAVLVAWGRDEMLVIYRSLARPALRAFLGHQTGARFLVALFTRDGELEPIVKVED
jgi:hypothetical protein